MKWRTVIEQGANPIQVSQGSKTDAEAALYEARAWSTPLTLEASLSLLSQLYLKTVRAGSTDEDFKARMKIYARELERYPADIARDAIQGWRGQFFPTWGELAAVIEADNRLGRRRNVIAAFEEYIRGDANPARRIERPDASFIERMKQKYRPEDDHGRNELTPEQFEAIRIVDEKFGDAARAKNGKWRPLSELEKIVVSERA